MSSVDNKELENGTMDEVAVVSEEEEIVIKNIENNLPEDNDQIITEVVIESVENNLPQQNDEIKNEVVNSDSSRKKRGGGRRKKVKVVQEELHRLPTSATEGKSPEIAEELHHAYQLFNNLIKNCNVSCFMNKPNANSFGMADYYNVVKNPIWLLEVKNKFENGLYNGIHAFLNDMVLLLENCYKFWGPKHKRTNRALLIERKLQQHIEKLPGNLSKTLSHYFGPESNENNYDGEDETISSSKLLTKVMDDEENELEQNNDELKELEKIMLKWEKENLVTEKDEEIIRCSWELAEIGHFLKLTFEAFNIEEVSQYEVERMLLMPRESLSLCTLMTSLLSQEHRRPALDETPLMPYNVWTAKLSRKLDDWFALLYRETDPCMVFDEIGVEPYFWDVNGLLNPLREKPFHELTFYKRIWILKSFLNYIFHTNKSIQELFLEDAESTFGLRPTFMGKNTKGFKYYTLPFFPEIRVYKEAVPNIAKWKGWKCLETGCYRFLKFYLTEDWNEEEQFMYFKPSADQFVTVAYDIDSLTSVIKEVEEDGLESLATDLNIILESAKIERCNIDGLKALYDQWKLYRERTPEYFEDLMNSWLRTEKPPNSRSDIDIKPENCVLGKRRTTFRLYSDTLESENSIESDCSDWESSHVKQKKRKVNDKNSVQKGDQSGDDQLKIVSVQSIKDKDNVISISSDDDDDLVVTAVSKPYSKKVVLPVLSEVSIMPAVSKTKVINITFPPGNTPIRQYPPATKMPKPIEVPMPQPMPQPIPQVRPSPSKIVPKPMIMPQAPSQISPRRGSPRGANTQSSPRGMSPRGANPQMNQRGQFSPRGAQFSPRGPQFSPRGSQLSPRGPNPQFSPRGGAQFRQRSPQSPMNRGGVRPRGNSNSPIGKLNPRQLFTTERKPVPAPMQMPPDTIEGALTVGVDLDGTVRYKVKLQDGGVINLSRNEIERIKRQNNGTLPPKVKVPLVKNKF